MTNVLKSRAAAIRASGLFVDREYSLLAEAALRGQDPAEHYLASGEARGARPSRAFDPAYYKRRYGLSGDSPLIHYLLVGRSKGLRPRPIREEYALEFKASGEGRERLVLVVGDGAAQSASLAAGALARELQQAFDVIALFMAPGDLVSRLKPHLAGVAAPRAGAQPVSRFDEEDREDLVAWLAAACQPGVAICHGLDHHRLLPSFSRQFVATLLIAGGASSDGSFAETYAHTSAAIFPSVAIQQDWLRVFPALRSRRMALAAASLPSGATEPQWPCHVVAECAIAACREMETIREDYAAILGGPAVWEKIFPKAITPGDLAARGRLRENLLVRGRDTGEGPIFPSPRLLPDLDERAVWRARGARDGHAAVHHLLRGFAAHAPPRPCIRPVPGIQPSDGLRVALHGHYFYPELAEEMLEALSRNRQPVDLFLSVDTEEKRRQLDALLGRFSRRAEIRVLPNRGRDVAALFTGFHDLFAAGYDVVGHVHGKKSPQYGAAHGDRWRKALLGNVIGFKYQMMDAILAAFAADPAIGLVFPAVDNHCCWDGNHEEGLQLAARMGLASDLSIPVFEYPAGMMFWCRPGALWPLLELRLDWEDYPPEPIPIDGTIAHAIERLLPFVCEAQGFRYAVTRASEA